ncbi:hypothetical protein B0T17DRAFT_516988 [Bombardia bombarda]|uniref:Secreted protein n=1 Tax=Bombardia bombarda TaxID=252184 RepID=A0AA39XLB0_9PEZI|nr:hypothetical protein B0T17DRAFT_516988 [Bombardia bombarda]
MPVRCILCLVCLSLCLWPALAMCPSDQSGDGGVVARPPRAICLLPNLVPGPQNRRATFGRRGVQSQTRSTYLTLPTVRTDLTLSRFPPPVVQQKRNARDLSCRPVISILATKDKGARWWTLFLFHFPFFIFFWTDTL